MNVVLTQRATNDLLSIQQYISQRNPERAETFVEELLERCYDLADMATAFPLVPRYERYGIRRRSHGNYLIFYQITGDQIEVIHILHGAREYLPLLFHEANDAAQARGVNIRDLEFKAENGVDKGAFISREAGNARSLHTARWFVR